MGACAPNDAADMIAVRAEVLSELRRLTASHDDATAVRRATRGAAKRLLHALEQCFYEGWNNGFCNVRERFCDEWLTANARGDAAEALLFLSEAGIGSATKVFGSLYRPAEADDSASEADDSASEADDSASEAERELERAERRESNE